MVELKVTNTNQTVNLFNGKKPFPFSVQKERGFFYLSSWLFTICNIFFSTVLHDFNWSWLTPLSKY